MPILHLVVCLVYYINISYCQNFLIDIFERLSVNEEAEAHLERSPVYYLTLCVNSDCCQGIVLRLNRFEFICQIETAPELNTTVYRKKSLNNWLLSQMSTIPSITTAMDEESTVIATTAGTQMPELSPALQEDKLPQCSPVAIRSSGSDYYVFYKGSNSLWNFHRNSITGIVAGSPGGQKSKSSYYADLGTRDANAAFRAVKGGLISVTYTYFFIGPDLEVHGGLVYKLQSGYPKLACSVFPAPCPSFTNAASYNGNDLTLLLSGDIMYLYTTSGNPPNLGFTFLKMFDITVNTNENIFSALVNSPLPTAPSGISALYAADSNQYMHAFVGTKFYIYSSGSWEYQGQINTPC